jgi:hypothetical protein
VPEHRKQGGHRPSFSLAGLSHFFARRWYRCTIARLLWPPTELAVQTVLGEDLRGLAFCNDRVEAPVSPNPRRKG